MLAFLRDLDLEARRIDAWKLRAAAHWADLHPATTDTGAATLDGIVLDPDETLGGDGTPAVAAFTPEELGVVLRVSPTSATALVADALDLRHRLPLLWRSVMRCETHAWLARRVAQQTRGLSRAGAAYVDDTLAARTTGWGTGILDRVVAQPSPDSNRRPRDPRGTSQGHLGRQARPTPRPPSTPAPASSSPAATPWLLNASTTRSIDSRPRRTTSPPSTHSASSPTPGQQPAARPGQDTRSTCTSTPPTSTPTTVGDRLGRRGSAPATTAKIKEWVGHSRVTIVPVLDLDRDDPVD